MFTHSGWAGGSTGWIGGLIHLSRGVCEERSRYCTVRSEIEAVVRRATALDIEQVVL